MSWQFILLADQIMGSAYVFMDVHVCKNSHNYVTCSFVCGREFERVPAGKICKHVLVNYYPFSVKCSFRVACSKGADHISFLLTTQTLYTWFNILFWWCHLDLM